MKNKIILITSIILLIIFSFNVFAYENTKEFRDGDFRIRYDTSDTTLEFENGWFAFDNIITVDSDSSLPGNTSCVPAVRLGGNWYRFNSTYFSHVEVVDSGNYFEYIQYFKHPIVGNFTRRLFITQSEDMYILIQDQWIPTTNSYDNSYMYGTCLDFKNIEHTKLYDGKGLDVVGAYTSADNYKADDFTMYASISPWNVYAKVLNGGTVEYRVDSTYPTTFTHYNLNENGAMVFERHLLDLFYDYTRNYIYFGGTSLTSEDRLEQTIFLSVNSHDPALSPYYVERQESRKPEEFLKFGGGKIGGYDSIAGYSYNLLSLATYGAKFSSLYWNTPRQDESYGYLIDRDLYKQSLYVLRKLVDDGEEFKTKYHYIPDQNANPNVNGTPNEHFQMYDLASTALYSVVAQQTLQKSHGSYSLNADSETEGLLNDVVDEIYDIVMDNEYSLAEWGNYSWFMHSWDDSIKFTAWDGVNAPTSVAGHVISTSSSSLHATDGTNSRKVDFNVSDGTYGYVRKSFGAEDITNFDYFNFDLYINDTVYLGSNDFDVRFQIYDSGADYGQWNIRDKIEGGENHFSIDLDNADSYSGVLDLNAITEVRLIFYDSNNGDYSVYLDDFRTSPKWLQRSYVLNTHAEWLLTLWKMHEYGYYVDEDIMYDATNALIHYLPAFESEPVDMGGFGSFYTYRHWMDEEPFNGAIGNETDDVNSFARYHYFSTFVLANLIDTINKVDPDYDTSVIDDSLERACTWTLYYDTTGETSNANTRYICAFINLDVESSSATADAHFDNLINDPVPMYGEDIALTRTNVDFDQAYAYLIQKVPSTTVITASVYAKPETSDYWTLPVRTRGLFTYVDKDQLIGMTGDKYYDLNFYEVTGGIEASFDARNYGSSTSMQWWNVKIPSDGSTSKQRITQTDIPIEDIDVIDDELILDFNDTEICANKRVYADVFCNGDQSYDVTPSEPNVWESFDYEGVTIQVKGIDADGVCGFEQIRMKTTIDELVCYEIEEDIDNPVGDGGVSDPEGDGQPSGDVFESLDTIVEGFGLEGSSTKLLFAMIFIGIFLVAGAKYGGVTGAVLMGVLGIVGFSAMGYIPLWITVLIIVITAIVFSYTISKIFVSE